MKYDRLKEFKYASILACQLANGIGIPTSIIIVDSKYGKHYDTATTTKNINPIYNYEKGDTLRKTPPKGYPKVL